MPGILAIDTSTLTASVAALVDGEVVAERESGVNTHSQDLLRLIDEVLGEAGLELADLECIAVGAGPGSFTGLRIGMATAKGLCFAAGRPLTLVSSLAALARDLACARAPGDALVVPIMDARRQEIFAGFFCFEEGRPRPVADEQVMAPAALSARAAAAAEGREVFVGGDGWHRYREVLEDLGDPAEGSRATPSAASVAHLARGAEPVSVLAAAAPVYIRPSEAEIKFPDGNPGGSFKPVR